MTGRSWPLSLAFHRMFLHVWWVEELLAGGLNRGEELVKPTPSRLMTTPTRSPCLPRSMSSISSSFLKSIKLRRGFVISEITEPSHRERWPLQPLDRWYKFDAVADDDPFLPEISGSVSELTNSLFLRQ